MTFFWLTLFLVFTYSSWIHSKVLFTPFCARHCPRYWRHSSEQIRPCSHEAYVCVRARIWEREGERERAQTSKINIICHGDKHGARGSMVGTRGGGWKVGIWKKTVSVSHKGSSQPWATRPGFWGVEWGCFGEHYSADYSLWGLTIQNLYIMYDSPNMQQEPVT